jgi:hypothetical protein
MAIHVNAFVNSCVSPAKLYQPPTSCLFAEGFFGEDVKLREYCVIESMLEASWGDFTSWLRGEPSSSLVLYRFIVEP